jgi:hypothetical protein
MGSGEIVTLTRCGGSSKEGWSSSGMLGSLPGHGCATVSAAGPALSLFECKNVAGRHLHWLGSRPRPER